ncbi:PadR family transcriptional regulator [Entomobacter blattae]|uniref:Transcriptional regulator PadR-like family protein n=1 Tax=Entomobacter blattae TaxID=2762277 RepID=A0A7H1NQW0_9PROT|nr:PadR family transcriptional regulator [Entomobacter blattae]QNT78170.1 Transcriptional regulator PadR-like family protein [Entomobacter blattae]
MTIKLFKMKKRHHPLTRNPFFDPAHARHHSQERKPHRHPFKGGSRREGGIPMRLGRKLRSEDLQLLLLALLAEAPAHGYELITRLEALSQGFYKPSPGMIYPALTYLEEAEYATVNQEGSRKLYALTEAGHHTLDQQRELANQLKATLISMGKRMAEWQDTFYTEGDPAHEGHTEYFQARKALKEALHQKKGCSPEQEKALIALLKKTTQDILDI